MEFFCEENEGHPDRYGLAPCRYRPSIHEALWSGIPAHRERIIPLAALPFGTELADEVELIAPPVLFDTVLGLTAAE